MKRKIKRIKKFLPYKKAKILMKKLGIKNAKQYRKLDREFLHLPCHPCEVYKEWINWSDFLNTNFVSYKEAKKLMKKLGIESAGQYFKFKNKGKYNLPSSPSETYKEWVSWYDFFDKKPKNFLSYKEAKELMQKLGIKKWKQYYELDLYFYDLPWNPSGVYKKNWKNWNDFLGTDRNDIRRKYFLNHYYFKKWSHDMAYILGLIFADGDIGRDCIRITLHKDDGYLLKKVARKIVYSKKIPFYIASNRSVCQVVFSSKELYKDIINIFKKDKKYLRHNMPKVPKKYSPDFIRGLYDGDGCITCNKKGKKFESFLTSAHLIFLKQVKKLLQERAEIKGGY